MKKKVSGKPLLFKSLQNIMKTFYKQKQNHRSQYTEWLISSFMHKKGEAGFCISMMKEEHVAAANYKNKDMCTQMHSQNVGM